MKAGWKTVKLGEACSLLTGGTPSRQNPEYFGGDIRWLVSGDVNQKQIFECEGRITALGLENSNARLLPKDSVLIALAGQGKTRGTVAMLRVEATCNQSIVCMVPKDREKLLPEFLYYNLHGRYQEIRRLTGDDGNDRRGLNMGIIYDIQIPLPPLAEQKRIVAILDEAFKGIDEAKAKAEANIEDASLLLKSYFSSTFSQGGAEWAEKTLGDTCEMYQPKTIGMKDLVPDGPYPVFGANGVIGKYDKYNHEEPQLLITCRGATCGAVNISEHHSWITGNAMVVRPKDAEIDLQFLEFFFRGGIDISVAITGTAQPQITRTNLEPLIVRFPRSVAEQKNHVKTFKSLTDETRALANTYAQKLKMVNELKSSLLAQAFAGELTA